MADHPDAHFRERDTYGRLIVIADTFPAYSLIRNKAWNARVSASMIAMWRLAKAADDDLLVEMCFQLYAEDPGPLPVQAGNMRETLEALRRDPCRGRGLVWKSKKTTIGLRIAHRFWSNELGGNICEVDELFVVPEYRSQGFGKSLFEAIAQGDLWPTPIVGMALGVTPDNVRARRLYERLGFAAVGVSMVRRIP